ncbi:hypothetical protein E2C01_011543 [Portunus trituberculatus]|uniref:Uncharacterized protein n=1 Tax=Portunus trituberculatus TaxID=210409 RepID=A0A5B7DBG6_PORTR|nr:hypothetical protein [Portunus trituberculatus]
MTEVFSVSSWFPGKEEMGRNGGGGKEGENPEERERRGGELCVAHVGERWREGKMKSVRVTNQPGGFPD